jgi:hypothetical protein
LPRPGQRPQLTLLANLAIVSKRLGHASVTITNDLYGHVLRDANQRPAEAAEALIPRLTEPHRSATVHTSHARRPRRPEKEEALAEDFLF